MPQQPTITQLIARARTYIEARLPGSRPQARRSLVGIIAAMHANAVHGLYGQEVVRLRMVRYYQMVASRLAINTFSIKRHLPVLVHMQKHQRLMMFLLATSNMRQAAT